LACAYTVATWLAYNKSKPASNHQGDLLPNGTPTISLYLSTHKKVCLSSMQQSVSHSSLRSFFFFQIKTRTETSITKCEI